MLSLIVFLCGAAVMILELVGSRLLAPWLGASLVVWTGLIGVVLACLALGAWLGGRLADRRPEGRILSRIILTAAGCTTLTALGHNILLELASGLGMYLGVVLGGAALFGPASIFLGMVSPFAVRLALQDTQHAGRVAGRLYALSTAGSIAGTFLAGFVLMAHVGSTRMLLGLALVLGLCAVLAAGASRRSLVGLSIVILAVGLGLNWISFRERLLAEAGRHELDTAYSRVLVFDAKHAVSGRPVRVLATGPAHFQSAIYLDHPDELLLPYSRFFTLTALLAPHNGRVLTLGGGAYVAPRAIKALRPDLDMSVVELDPGITAAAQQFFDLKDDAGLRIAHADGRMFLQAEAAAAGPAWDVILLDVFDAQYALPAHLASVEFATLVRSRLRADGWVLMNTIGTREGVGSRLVASVARTFQAVFPWVRLYTAHPDRGPQDVQNMMLVAGSAPLPDLAGLALPDAELAAMLQTEHSLPEAGALRFTDDFAPTEQLAEALRREQSRRP